MIIVPDYGLTTDSDSVVALREACEALRLDFRIIPFPEAYIAEAPGDTDDKSERELIESSARVLECYAQNIPECTPSTLVVFGKAAMFTGMLEHIPILYINPEYDSEWPWKHQFYADCKQAENYYSCNAPERYGVFTTKEGLQKGLNEFSDRYSRNAVYEPELGLDPEKLAQLIYRFDTGSFTLPLNEIDESLRHFPQEVCHENFSKGLGEPLRTPLNREICHFVEPVKLEDTTVLGIEWGVPMANGQSGLKLRVAERDYTLPLERYVDRKSLNALRDAIVKTRQAIEGPAAKVSEVLRDIKPKSHYVTFNMPGIDREYDREFTIEPSQLRDAMLHRVLLGSRRGMAALGDLETTNFNLRDELREGIAEIIHSDYPELPPKDIKRKVEITYGEEELECYLRNLARFIRMVFNGRIPQRLVAKCFKQYFDVDVYEDGHDFGEWYSANYSKLYD